MVGYNCNLFFSKSENRYFWIGSDTCSKCKKIVSLQGILVWDYWQSQLIENLYCINCKAQALKSIGRYAEIKPVVLGFTGMLPEDVIGVWASRPQLVNSSGSVFEVATQKLEGKLVDKTLLSSSSLVLSDKVEKRKLLK